MQNNSRSRNPPPPSDSRGPALPSLRPTDFAGATFLRSPRPPHLAFISGSGSRTWGWWEEKEEEKKGKRHVKKTFPPFFSAADQLTSFFFFVRQTQQPPPSPSFSPSGFFWEGEVGGRWSETRQLSPIRNCIMKVSHRRKGRNSFSYFCFAAPNFSATQREKYGSALGERPCRTPFPSIGGEARSQRERSDWISSFSRQLPERRKKMGKCFLYFDCVTGLAQYGTVAQKGNQQENKKK